MTSSSDWFNPWAKITQGTGRNQRIGDKITPRGMSLKIYLAGKFDRPSSQFRLIVAILPKELAGTVTTNVFDPFQTANIGTLGNNMLFPPDSDEGVKFLYDKIHRVYTTGDTFAGGLDKEPTKVVKLWIKRKRSSPIVYNNSASFE